MRNNKNFKVGIDGGGTKCRAVVFDHAGAEIGAGVAGPANIARTGEHALSAIQGAVALALADAGLINDVRKAQDWLPRCDVSAGLAGATVAESVNLLTGWQHPFASFRFISDLHAALVGAHGGRGGAVMVVGTGSCSAALVDNQCVQFGGHGFVIGDKGSGAWFGLEAIRHTLEALDGVAPTTLLTERICDCFAAADPASFVNKLNNAPSSEFARVAGEVFTCAAGGDVAAQRIVTEGCEYLSVIAARAMRIGGGQIALVGGLAKVVRPYLSSAVRAAIKPAEQGPEWGAIHATL